eukprot:4033341-Prymnesium_polylepis.1
MMTSSPSPSIYVKRKPTWKPPPRLQPPASAAGVAADAMPMGLAVSLVCWEPASVAECWVDASAESAASRRITSSQVLLPAPLPPAPLPPAPLPPAEMAAAAAPPAAARLFARASKLVVGAKRRACE